jgi:hypothetical protein
MRARLYTKIEAAAHRDQYWRAYAGSRPARSGERPVAAIAGRRAAAPGVDTRQLPATALSPDLRVWSPGGTLTIGRQRAVAGVVGKSLPGFCGVIRIDG